jgi:hypothetical protein
MRGSDERLFGGRPEGALGVLLDDLQKLEVPALVGIDRRRLGCQ